MGDNANEQDREQLGHGQAPVSRRSFVVGVAAAGAAATAARALPGRLAAPGVPGAGAGRAAVSTCGSFSLVAPPPRVVSLPTSRLCLLMSGGRWATWGRRCAQTGR
jgi:hypothetical protein